MPPQADSYRVKAGAEVRPLTCVSSVYEATNGLRCLAIPRTRYTALRLTSSVEVIAIPMGWRCSISVRHQNIWVRILRQFRLPSISGLTGFPAGFRPRCCLLHQTPADHLGSTAPPIHPDAGAYYSDRCRRVFPAVLSFWAPIWTNDASAFRNWCTGCWIRRFVTVNTTCLPWRAKAVSSDPSSKVPLSGPTAVMANQRVEPLPHQPANRYRNSSMRHHGPGIEYGMGKVAGRQRRFGCWFWGRNQVHFKLTLPCTHWCCCGVAVAAVIQEDPMNGVHPAGWTRIDPSFNPVVKMFS